MPEVSIILPTYNRADTLPRAIASVLAQSFGDWELIVVDDGSTDNTAAIAENIDPRIRLVRQVNGGCYVARNHGIRVSTGKFITFLDSDDEWLPHYLELTTAFLRFSSEDQFVMTDFWADWGDGTLVWGADTLIREPYTMLEQIWAKLAREIGSHSLDLPPGETDGYMRIYETREPLGDWGKEVAARAGYPEAKIYRGHIFKHFRWGHLGWLPALMLKRQALEDVGLFLENYRTAADILLLASLSRRFQANLIAVPCAIKHAAAINSQALVEDHLASGVNEYRYAINRLPLFDELFLTSGQSDPETGRIRGLYHLYAGRTALRLGMRRETLMHLRDAVRAIPDHRRARWLLTLAYCLPTGAMASSVYRNSRRLHELTTSLLTGRQTMSGLIKKLWQRLTIAGTASRMRA